jgi:hypothetical protein
VQYFRSSGLRLLKWKLFNKVNDLAHFVEVASGEIL